MSWHNLGSFYVPWSIALAASVNEPIVIGATMLSFEGFEVPLVQAVLAVAGVLLARPLARKKEAGLSIWLFLVVTAIMLIVALLWVVESRPGVLFTFVVAIGLGFSGYSAIETAGREIETFIKRIIAHAAEALPSFKGKP